MYNGEEETTFETFELDESKHDFLGTISVYYDKDTGQMLFGVPISKDEETKQFLFNLIQEMIYVVNPDGMEC